MNATEYNENQARIASYIEIIERTQAALAGSTEDNMQALYIKKLDTLRSQYGHMVPKSTWN